MNKFSLTYSICIVFYFLFLVKQSYAQTNPVSEYIDQYSNIIPTTPNAASFITYGNTGVNLSKGTPNISIPIYNIGIDGVSIPINLSYDASGIRVNEMSSVVGLKWRLNAGGGIFRTINNVADENGWTTNNWTSLDNQWYLSNPISSTFAQGYIMSNPIDHSPDDFTYNFGSYYGGFIFKRKDRNTILKNKNDNIIIQQISNGQSFESFIAKDVNGNIYNFGTDVFSREINSNTAINGTEPGSSINTDISDSVSSWLITQITTKNNKTINFEYLAYDIEYYLYHRSHRIERKESYNGGNTISCSESNSGYQYGTYSYTKTTTSTRNNPKNKLISKIYTTTEEVNFIYENYLPSFMPEGDNIWGKKLVRIEVTDKINQKIVKIFNFTYDIYSGDPRLMLKEVSEEEPINATEKPPYVFIYNEDYNLPNKKSYSRDYHGYFNGANNPSLLIPFSEVAYAKLPTIYRDVLADRRPSFEHLVSGNLIEIQYPTGGSTKFEYELNQEDNGLGEYKYVYDNVSINTQSTPYITVGGYREYTTSTFTITDNTLYTNSVSNPSTLPSVRVITSISGYPSCDPEEPNYMPSIDCPHFYVYDATNNNQIEDKIIGLDGTIRLNPGSYYLVLKIDTDDYSNNPNLNANIDFKWVSHIEDGNNNLIREPKYSGGLRIKKIVDIDTPNTEYNETTFEYSGLTGQGWREDYVNKIGGYSWITSSDPMLHKRLNKSGYFYQNVIVRKNNGLESYKTLNVFEPDFENNSHSGKQSKTFLYDKDNKLVSKSFYIYNTNTTAYNYNILGKLDYCYDYNYAENRLGYNEPQNAIYTEFENRLIKEISTQYFYNNQTNLLSGKITNINEYNYNPDELILQKTTDLQLTEIQDLDYYDIANYNLNTNNKKTTVDYTYPRNHLSESIFQDFVNNRNLLATPVSIKVNENSNQLSGSFLEYDTNGNITKLYKHNKGLGTNNSSYNYIPSNYELNSSYNITDGKLIESSKKDGTPISYIWGYNNIYPVAKVVNATYTEIENIAGLNLNLGSSGLSLNQETVLRNALPNAQIFIYEYEPLVGLISTTDPRGYKITYYYDDFNRLEFVKDQDGNILSENEYNYKN